MSTVTFRVNESEKAFMRSMAKFNGVSLSELARTRVLENLQSQLDIAAYEQAMQAHLQDDCSISHQQMKRKLGI